MAGLKDDLVQWLAAQRLDLVDVRDIEEVDYRKTWNSAINHVLTHLERQAGLAVRSKPD